MSGYTIDDLVWDEERGWVQVTRFATAEEAAEIDQRRNSPPPVPESISSSQFRQSLTHSGLRSQWDSAVASATQDIKDWYEYETSFDRHHPNVLSLAQQLSIDSSQLDAVWRYGASI
jgi:hypothetical protein